MLYAYQTLTETNLASELDGSTTKSDASISEAATTTTDFTALTF